MDQKIPETGVKRYDELPEAVKHQYTVQEYLWLPEKEKANLIQTETEPDHFED